MSTTIRFHQYGSPDVLAPEEEQVGMPGPAQVRLRHEAIGVNFIDTAFRQGVFPMALPGVTGVEGAGIVEAVGSDVQGIQAGDRMAYFLAPGSYAEVRLIDASDLIRSPEDLSSAEIATVLTKGLTAWAALNGFYPLKAGETVLVQGASSNVGWLVSRWAKARGARVIGTAGSATKQAAIAGSVDHVLPSGSDDLAARIRAIAPNGVDVVYEFVGKATFAASAAAVRDGGTIVTIGAASGSPAIDQADLDSRNVRVVGGPMAQYVQGRVAQASDEVFDAYRKGIFGDFKATVYPLVEAAAAHEDIAARRKSGPMILVP
ncbi:zinc-binding dehydrogenase [Pseudoxanthomonas sacheonensis]|uniref:NADPH2:quinone reductase n=1 Tax=Pseudoxanthomonas sacheonensis TaxID=443615 RepID=A0ABU1RMW1_9GAMM|nr:zinc-binding dehydrogenase [Pseudoxanthomonas sacheonensis]MDR6840100.1 NADPH2:quinone reductase [Pseudoxanthomonas sacheonensis]